MNTANVRGRSHITMNDMSKETSEWRVYEVKTEPVDAESGCGITNDEQCQHKKTEVASDIRMDGIPEVKTECDTVIANASRNAKRKAEGFTSLEQFKHVIGCRERGDSVRTAAGEHFIRFIDPMNSVLHADDGTVIDFSDVIFPSNPLSAEQLPKKRKETMAAKQCSGRHQAERQLSVHRPTREQCPVEQPARQQHSVKHSSRQQMVQRKVSIQNVLSMNFVDILGCSVAFTVRNEHVYFSCDVLQVAVIPVHNGYVKVDNILSPRFSRDLPAFLVERTKRAWILKESLLMLLRTYSNHFRALRQQIAEMVVAVNVKDFRNSDEYGAGTAAPENCEVHCEDFNGADRSIKLCGKKIAVCDIDDRVFVHFPAISSLLGFHEHVRKNSYKFIDQCLRRHDVDVALSFDRVARRKKRTYISVEALQVLLAHFRSGDSHKKKAVTRELANKIQSLWRLSSGWKMNAATSEWDTVDDTDEYSIIDESARSQREKVESPRGIKVDDMPRETSGWRTHTIKMEERDSDITNDEQIHHEMDEPPSDIKVDDAPRETSGLKTYEVKRQHNRVRGQTIDTDNKPPPPEHLITDDEDEGSCYQEEDMPICHCPPGWQGPMCEGGYPLSAEQLPKNREEMTTKQCSGKHQAERQLPVHHPTQEQEHSALSRQNRVRKKVYMEKAEVLLMEYVNVLGHSIAFTVRNEHVYFSCDILPVAGMSLRRQIDYILAPHFSRGLPAFLVERKKRAWILKESLLILLRMYSTYLKPLRQQVTEVVREVKVSDFPVPDKCNEDISSGPSIKLCGKNIAICGLDDRIFVHIPAILSLLGFREHVKKNGWKYLDVCLRRNGVDVAMSFDKVVWRKERRYISLNALQVLLSHFKCGYSDKKKAMTIELDTEIQKLAVRGLSMTRTLDQCSSEGKKGSLDAVVKQSLNEAHVI